MVRQGVSLLEFVVFSALSLALIGYGWDLLRSGSIIGSNSYQGIALQAGVRNLMENMVKDVNASVFIKEPNGLTTTPATKVVVWIFSDAKESADKGMVKPGERINFNNGGPDSGSLTGGINPYPFAHAGNPTRWHLPVLEVTYEWDASAQIVTREAAPGDLWMEAEDGTSFFQDYSFHPLGGASIKKVLSENISEFEVYPFGYDETNIDSVTQMGSLKPTRDTPDFVTGLATAGAGAPTLAGFGTGTGGSAGSTERIGRTAMLLVKLKAIFDYKHAKYRDPEFQMATKIWSYAKLYEHRYFQYFSSIDDDLRF
jgi:hypothetical protein